MKKYLYFLVSLALISQTAPAYLSAQEEPAAEEQASEQASVHPEAAAPVKKAPAAKIKKAKRSRTLSAEPAEQTEAQPADAQTQEPAAPKPVKKPKAKRTIKKAPKADPGPLILSPAKKAKTPAFPIVTPMLFKKFGVRVHISAVSPSGEYMALALGDKITIIRRDGVALWNLKSPYSGDMTNLSFTPNGKFIYGLRNNMVADIWRTDNWSYFASYKMGSISPFSVTNSGQYVAVADSSGITVRRITDNKEIKRLPGRTAPIAFSDDDRVMACLSLSISRQVETISTTDWNPIKLFVAYSGDVSSMQFSPNGKYIATASPSGNQAAVRIYNTADGSLLKSIQVTPASDMGVAFSFSQNSDLLAARLSPDYLGLIELPSGKQISAVSAHYEKGESIGLTGQGGILASSGAQFSLLMWGRQAFYVKNDNTSLEPAQPGKPAVGLFSGTRVDLAAPEGKRMLVTTRDGVQGYLQMDAVTSERPDMIRPQILILENNSRGKKLKIKGVVLDDVGFRSVSFSNTQLPITEFDFNPSNYKAVYPFYIEQKIKGDMQPVIVAEDFSGKKAYLILDDETPVSDFDPFWGLYKTIVDAKVMDKPDPFAEVSMTLPAETPINVIGSRNNWYRLETGNWIFGENIAKRD